MSQNFQVFAWDRRSRLIGFPDFPQALELFRMHKKRTRRAERRKRSVKRSSEMTDAFLLYRRNAEET